MTGTLAFNNGNKISLLGAKTYNINSSVGNEQLNVVSNTGKGLIIAGADDTLYYFDGENRYRILNEGDGVANSDLSNLSNTGLSKFVLKEGDSMTGALYVPSPADDDNSTRVATTAWVNRILGSGKVLGRMDFDSGINVSVTQSSSYTIPDDGYIFILSANTDLYINGKRVFSNNFGGTHLIPVSKNDVLSLLTGIMTGTVVVTFCPQKTN